MLGWKNHGPLGQFNCSQGGDQSQRHAELLWWEIRSESKARAFANSKHHSLRLLFSCAAIILTQSIKKEVYSTRHIFKLQNHQIWAVLSCSIEKNMHRGLCSVHCLPFQCQSCSHLLFYLGTWVKYSPR